MFLGDTNLSDDVTSTTLSTTMMTKTTAAPTQPPTTSATSSTVAPRAVRFSLFGCFPPFFSHTFAKINHVSVSGWWVGIKLVAVSERQRAHIYDLRQRR